MEIKGGKGGIDGDIQRDGGGEMEIEVEVERLRWKKQKYERDKEVERNQRNFILIQLASISAVQYVDKDEYV